MLSISALRKFPVVTVAWLPPDKRVLLRHHNRMFRRYRSRPLADDVDPITRCGALNPADPRLAVLLELQRRYRGTYRWTICVHARATSESARSRRIRSSGFRFGFAL